MIISIIKYNLPKSHQISHEIPPSVYKMIFVPWKFLPSNQSPAECSVENTHSVRSIF